VGTRRTKGTLPSPAALLRSGGLDGRVMMLPFYEARVTIRGGERPRARFSTVRGPRLAFDLDLDDVARLRDEISEPGASCGPALPVETEFLTALRDATRGPARAFLAVFGADGRHLLDAVRWAMDEKFVPERAEVTCSLAKFWRRDRAVRGTDGAAADAWFERAGA